MKSGLIGRWRQIVTSHAWVTRLEILLTCVKICFTKISSIAILTDTSKNIESLVTTAITAIIIFFLHRSANSLVLTRADVNNRTQDCIDGSISYYEFYVDLRQNKKKVAFPTYIGISVRPLRKTLTAIIFQSFFSQNSYNNEWTFGPVLSPELFCVKRL